MQRRLKAVQAAKAREAEEAERRAAEERARDEERARKKAEIEAREIEEAERKRAEEEARKQAATDEARAAAAATEPEPVPEQPAAKTAAPKRPEKPREEDRRARQCGASRNASGARPNGRGQAREKVTRDVQIPETIVVQELANRMAERVADVVKALMQNGIMATQNQSIDADTAELIVEEFGHRVVRVSDADVEDVITQGADDDAADLKPRPPVITIMGHVDHGKTSLLDRDPQVQCGLGRGRRHHPAYRRLSGDDRFGRGPVFSTRRATPPSPRCGPRRAGDRYRHPGGRGR
jgi:translation initiation factor IF-2